MNRRLLTAVLTAILALGGLACGGKQSPVQPDDLKVGAGECSKETLVGDSEPFIVAWEASTRENLELAMENSVVLVKYDCNGVQVVDTCQVEGNYAYRGLQMRSKTVQMQDQVGSVQLYQTGRDDIGVRLFNDKMAVTTGSFQIVVYM